jgi:iron complex outermembrane receptor protein
MENLLANTKLSWTPDESSKLTAVGSFLYSPKSDDPGALTSAEENTDRRQASQRNVDFDAGEKVRQATLGLSYVKRFGDEHELTAAGYYVWRDFDNLLPFMDGGAVDLKRDFGGASLQYGYEDELFGMGDHLLLGVDVDAQRDDRRRRNNDSGAVGALTFDQSEDVTAWRIFLQNELDLCDDLELTVGAGFDSLVYEVDDDFGADGDDSDRRTFDEWSPMAALLWSPWPALNAYFRFSTSFEPPTTAELANPDGSGGFNSDLDPQRTMNYEIGIKGLLLDMLRYEVVGFWMKSRDELVPYELPSMPGRSFFRNAGRSTRRGVETSAQLRPVEGLTLSVVYTYSDFEFDHFEAPTGSFDGNSIPGIPEHHLFTEIFYRSSMGLYGGFDLRWVDSFYADDANSVDTDDYLVANLRLGYSREFGGWEVGPYFGIENLFDEHYIDNVRLNAGFGRYFEPAPVRSYYGGLSVAYHFGDT